ncbi:MAG: sugar phosphate isomerase/epimerase [Armatimonadetes bacterium]|nr:sugar phosphate isomerase/epimerase [Armatimonadota bacterium]
MKRPLGVSTTLLEKEFEPKLLGEVAARGITHLELFVSPGISYFDRDEAVHALVAEAGRHGLTFWSIHAPFGPATDLSNPEELARRAAVQAVVRALEIGVMTGAELVVIHAGLALGDEEEVRFRRRQSIRSINELCKLSSQRGLGLAVEYLATNGRGLGISSADLLDLFSVVDGTPGVCMDTNHANLGEPLNDAMRALGERIQTLHISDNDGIVERHLMPGEGTIDWSGFTRILDDIGYAGPLMYEASNSGDGVPERLDLVVSSAREQLGWRPV